MIGVTTPPNFHRRNDEHRVPVYRSPALHYDMLPENLALDSSNRSALISDRSGNSAVNVLCLNGVAGNYASFTALTAFGTGAFSVSARVSTAGLAASQGVIGGAANSFSLRVIVTTGKLEADKTGTSAVTQSTGAITAFQDAVVGYTRTGTTGTYYINGAAVGTVVDATDYTVGCSEIGSVGIGTANPFNGLIQWARVYTAALTAPEMLADAGGTVQANCSFNENFATASKLATSVTATTGQTVTINSVGDLGARIAGARDACQFTLGKEAVYTAPAGGSKGFITEDGSNDYQKAPAFPLAQPEFVLFVGSAVSWTASDYLLDGNTLNTMSLSQQTSTPNVAVYAGAFLSAITTWALNTNAIITAVFNSASSANRLNRTAAITGNAGTGTPKGLTVGASGTPGGYANITASELLIYQGAQYDSVARERLTRQKMRYHRIAA